MFAVYGSKLGYSRDRDTIGFQNHPWGSQISAKLSRFLIVLAAVSALPPSPAAMQTLMVMYSQAAQSFNAQ